MCCLEAQHSPSAGYGDDDDTFQKHDDPPNSKYGPRGHCCSFRERDRHSHKYTAGNKEGKEAKPHRKQQSVKLSTGTEYPHNRVLNAEEEATHGE